MTVNRIYGQDVLVRLFSNDGITPYIVDFDTIEINSLTTTQSYKGIGRKLQKHQSINSGYKIVLTRAKRDNHLQALVHFNDYHIQKGLEQPFFKLDYIVNHTYNIKNYNVIKRLSGNQDPLFSSTKNIVMNDGTNFKIPSLLTNLVANGAEALLKKNDGIKQAIDTVKDGKKLIDGIGTKVKAITKLFQDSASRTIYTQPLYQELKARINFLPPDAKDNFVEEYYYNNCVIGEFSSSDRVNENSIETITLYATDKNIMSEDNFYDDKYMMESFEEQLNTELKKNQDNIIKIVDQKQSNILDDIKKNFNKTLEEIYGNLL